MSLLETTLPTARGRDIAYGLAGPNEARARLSARAWSLRATALACASVVLFACAAFLAWYATAAVVPWDSKNQFYPMFRFLADALQHGEIPSWNPYQFGGYPAIADPQSLIFTPSMVLFALVAPHASMQVFDVVIMAHLCCGGLGVVAVFRQRRWHPAAAVLAAAIFMLGGAASARLQHTGMIISYAYFPLALITLESMLERCSYWRAVLFGVLAACLALGRDQVAYLMALILIGRVIWLAIAAQNRWAYLRPRIGPLALAGFVGAALMVVPVLLTMQFLGASNRPGIAYGVAAAGSLFPVNLVTLLIPNFFGSLDWNYDYWGPGYETMTEPDWTDRSINYLFIGTLPILIFLWHGFAAGRIFAREARFFLAILVAGLIYAIGHYTPLFGWAFDLFPGVSLYRRPADATFIVNIGFAFLAGYLLHRFIVDGLPQRSRVRPRWLGLAGIGVTVIAVATLIGAGLAWSLHQGYLPRSLVQLGIFVGCVAVAASLLLAVRTRRSRVVAAGLLVFLSAGELVWRNAASSLNAEPASRYSVFGTMAPTNAAGLDILRREVNEKISQGDHPRVEILGMNGPWQNAAMVFKFEDTLGYNPLRIADYERAVGPGENAQDLGARHFPDTFRGYKCKLASLLGLEYLVLDRPLAKLPRHFPRPAAATLIYSGDSMYVYRLGEAAPRAYFATHVRPVDAEAILDEHTLPDFDRAHDVLIDGESLGDIGTQIIGNAEEPSAKAAVSLVKYEDTSVELSVDTDKPGVVVLHDIFYPGWRVRVDGHEKPVLRANILFRGVEVPAGHHSVRFSFEPLSLANLAAAGSSLLQEHGEE
jgi:Bacterial membrane protein YfhO